jgi:hypothetical protein
LLAMICDLFALFGGVRALQLVNLTRTLRQAWPGGASIRMCRAVPEKSARLARTSIDVGSEVRGWPETLLPGAKRD